MESSDKPPSYKIQKESVGYHRKCWTVRLDGKFKTAFGKKGEAAGWIITQERRKGK